MLTVENEEGAGNRREERILILHQQVVFVSEMGISPPLPVFTLFLGARLSLLGTPLPLPPLTSQQPPPSQPLPQWEERGARWTDASPLATEPGLHGSDPVSKVQKLGGAGMDCELAPVCEASLWGTWGPEECWGE